MLPVRRQVTLLISLLLVLSCTTRLTDKQRVYWGLNVYTAQYNLYLDQILAPSVTGEERAKFYADPSLITDNDMKPDISEDQWKALRIKKEILIELKPMVIIAATRVETGQIPSAELQGEMTRLLNKLIETGI
jgi:hypothetical protein